MSSEPNTLSVRPEAPRDYHTIHTLVTAAFGRESEAKLVRLLRADADAYIPELALVAEEGGEIIGHVMLTNATLHSDEEWRVAPPGAPAGAPGRQREGAGTAPPAAALPPDSTTRPPPNVNGSLHMGHALTFTLQ